MLLLAPAQAFNSFGIGYRLTGEEDYRTRVLTAAESLYDFRFQVNTRPPLFPFVNAYS